jgi:hypothetical protein
MASLIDPGTGRPIKLSEVSPSPEILNLRREIAEVLRRRAMRSKYDAAQTTSQNENHWHWADELSPNAANSLAVRKKLRSRSRYETANNGYLRGILLTKSQDTIGSGPTLQITDVRFTTEQKTQIEKAFKRRAKKIQLRRKLRQMSFAKMQDGEGFAFRTVDRKLQDGVKVNQTVIECDQVSHFEAFPADGTTGYVEIDGVRYSQISGEPEQYHLLNQHPGDNHLFTPNPITGRWVNARDVIHWFRRDRPWNRGIPETVSTLPLWALLRRYTLAVVQNAEIAADFTVLLKSIQAPGIAPFASTGSSSSTSPAADWFDAFPVDRGLMTVLPDKYEATQLDPKQPVSVYDVFVNALIQEAARPLLVPRNLALGNSGGYNMASGALDMQMYNAAIKDERCDCEDEVLDKDLHQWWFEAVRTPDYFADEVGGESTSSVVRKFAQLRNEPPDHVWRWDDVQEHTDPVKVATALNILHAGGHLSDVDIQEGRFNRRVEDHYENLEQQNKRRKELGLISTPDQQSQGESEPKESEE